MTSSAKRRRSKHPQHPLTEGSLDTKRIEKVIGTVFRPLQVFKGVR
jgi:hypothetical protein